MPLPSGFSFGTVVGRFLLASADSSDPDTEPDASPPANATVTFTPSTSRLLGATTTPPATIIPAPIVCTLNANGDLIDGSGNTGIRLIATDDPDVNPAGWTWNAEVVVEGFKYTFSFLLPGGTTVDLAQVTPVPDNSGTFYAPPGMMWELYQEWTTPGTYTPISIPNNAIAAEWRATGPGAGGGSGRRGLTSEIRCGGGGGAGGATIVMPVAGSLLNEQYTITVPAGAPGGAAVSTDNTNGNNGGLPSTLTIVGSVTGNVVFIFAPSVAGGGGGLGVAGAGGTGRINFEGVLPGGGASAAAGTAGASGAFHTNRGANGGGGGGGLTAANVASAGGNSSFILSRNKVATGGAINTAGPAGYTLTTNDKLSGLIGGGGGAGGGSSAAGAGGAGGNGGYPGGGGGGGGASSNGQLSGAGGNGADGYVGLWVLRAVIAP